MSGTTSARRLDRHVRPVAYHLHLDADPARPTFNGELTIDLEVVEATASFRLHSKDLTLGDAKMEQQGQTLPLTLSPEPADEMVEFRASRPLGLGKARLHLSYDGKVAEGMAGLYLSKDGTEVCLATQCEATDARAILPCFDEPDRKATFAWKVTAPKGLEVLTNGAVLKKEEKGDRTVWSFTPTPPMSSYLVAMAMGQFAAEGPVTVNGIPFRVWSLGGKQNLGVHARDIAAKMLPWYETYFGQPYPFGKYDQAAVPSFAFGAMENAGLVIFRPSALLVDPKQSAWDDRKSVALVVAHEFAHMWFGDLVTMAWWDDLWLNEAFAEWMAHKIVDSLQPDLDVWHSFRSRAAGALSTDTLERTHAIYHPVKSPAEAAEMFDAITYGKGSAVMRMIEGYLGEESFRTGLRSYMAAFRFGNAKGADLWSHLGKASGQDVAAIMQDWVGQPGHPMVTCSLEAGELVLRQQRARSSPLLGTSTTLWRVPLVLRYKDDAGLHSQPFLLAGAEQRLRLQIKGKLHWLWPNAGDMAFVSVSLDETLLAGVISGVRDLAAGERVALVRDLWMEVRSGQRPIASFLAAFAKLLDGEAPYDVLDHMVGMLRAIERLLEADATAAPALTAYRAWVASHLQASYRKLGPEPHGDEDNQTRERRSDLLRAVAGIGREPKAVGDARAVAAKERKNPALVDANVAGMAVAVEAILGDASTLATHLATIQARRDAHASPQEVERYLYLLGAFRSPDLVAKVLVALAEGTIAPQAVGPILRAMLTEPHAQRAAWSHVKSNWTDIVAKLGPAWVANLVEAAGELPPELESEVLAFFDANLKGMAAQAYGRAKERLHERAEFLPRIMPGLRQWAGALRAN